MATTTGIEAMYPLSPMQELLVLHRLQAGVGDRGLVQGGCTLEGELDSSVLKLAWERVVERHAALRTSIHWLGLDRPLQVVHARVDLQWSQTIHEGLNPADREDHVQASLRAGREAGLDLSRAPLLSLVLLRFAAGTHQLLWTFHHIVLDGWSAAIVLREVFAVYASLRLGEELSLEPAGSYRDYVGWLERQDLAGAEKFWRKRLSGFASPTPLGPGWETGASPASPADHDTVRVVLGAAATDLLQAFARARRLTINELVQGAWALLLGAYSGRSDVVFGSTVSGRPPELDGVEQMVGMFINTVPIRVRLDPDLSVLAYLSELHERQIEARRYECVPLVKLQEWTEVELRSPLFESLLVFENYPWDGPSQLRGGVKVGAFRGGLTATFPLTVVATLGEEMELQLVFDRRRFDGRAASGLLRHFRNLLESFPARSQQRLSELPLVTEAEREQFVRPSGGQGASGCRDSRAAPDEFVLPRTANERLIADLWSELLGLKEVGARDNFRDLGGSSLLGMKVIETLRRTLGVSLNPAELTFQTLGQLAAICDERSRAAGKHHQGRS